MDVHDVGLVCNIFRNYLFFVYVEFHFTVTNYILAKKDCKELENIKSFA